MGSNIFMKSYLDLETLRLSLFVFYELLMLFEDLNSFRKYIFKLLIWMRFSNDPGSIVHESACVGVSGVRLQKDNCFKKEQPSGSGYICTRCLGSYVGLVKREGGSVMAKFWLWVECKQKKDLSFLSSIVRLFVLNLGFDSWKDHFYVPWMVSVKLAVMFFFQFLKISTENFKRWLCTRKN